MVRYRTAILILATIGMVACDTVSQRRIPGCLEITQNIVPVGDGELRRLALTGKRLCYETTGPGSGAIEDGRFYEVDIERSSIRKEILFLGENSPFSKEDEMGNYLPLLAGVPSETTLVINLVAAETFPTPMRRSQTNPEGQVANVFLYDVVDRTFTNLTKLTYASRKHAQALRWFAKEQVILLEESQLSDSGTPLPRKGTEVPFCIQWPTLQRRDINEFPSVTAWHRTSRSISVRCHGAIGEQSSWSVSHGSDETRPLLEVKLPASNVSGPLILVVDPAMICVAGEGCGTFLVPLNNEGPVWITERIAIDYDFGSGYLFLRSRQHDENGEYRYWALDLKPYLQIPAKQDG